MEKETAIYVKDKYEKNKVLEKFSKEKIGYPDKYPLVLYIKEYSSGKYVISHSQLGYFYEANKGICLYSFNDFMSGNYGSKYISFGKVVDCGSRNIESFIARDGEKIITYVSDYDEDEIDEEIEIQTKDGQKLSISKKTAEELGFNLDED